MVLNPKDHSEATDTPQPTPDIAALSAQLTQLTTMVMALSTRIEAMEARSRPLTPTLPDSPVTSPPASQTAPQITQQTTQQATRPATHVDERWRPEEVGYFDGSGDVFAFTDRLSSIAALKGVRLVQMNLVTVLKDAAFNWYHYELLDDTKRALNTNTVIDPWCQVLIERFEPSHSELIAQLEACRYTRNDAANKEDATAYVQEIMKITKGLKRNQHDGVMTAFHHFEPTLQRDLNPYAGLTQFIKQVQLRQSAWYQVYSAFSKPRPLDPPSRHHQTQLRPQNQPYQQYRQQPPQPSQQYDWQARPQQAYWADEEEDWVYDAPADCYYAYTPPAHPPGHTPRRYGNTHDSGGDEAMANWASAGEDHRCSHEGCTHYH